jgi:hypothetical protein
MNRLNLQKLMLIIAVGVLLQFPKAAFSQQNQTQDKVAAYLQSYLKGNSEKPSSLHNRFAEFLPLPADLQSSLLLAFPKHRFFVAKTLYTHWMPNDGEANILIVTDAASGEAVGHLWAIWFSSGTESFNHLLETYETQSPKDALEKVKVLSQLIVSLNNWKVGRVYYNGRTITAELGGSENPWRILIVKTDRRTRFGRMVFINPKNGKEM